MNAHTKTPLVEVEAMIVSRADGRIQIELADWQNRYCFEMTEGQARSLVYSLQDRLNTPQPLTP